MTDLEEAIEALEDMVNQHCQIEFTDKKITFDSMALSANADAMRVLVKHKKIEIISECGRRIHAKKTLKNT